MDMHWAEREMAGAKVPDRRVRNGLGRVIQALAAQPQASFSAACGPAGRQVAFRCFRRDDTPVPHLLAGHFEETVARAAGQDLVLVAQDTTDFDYSYSPTRTGLGPIDKYERRHGLLAHSALALSPAGEPLGVVHLDFWVRDPAARGTAAKRRQKLTEDKESAKWDEGREGVEAVFPATQPLLLIQDREGDVFAFLAAPRREQTHLLIRAAQARSVWLPEGTAAAGTLLDVIAAAPVLGTLVVEVPTKRTPATAAAGKDGAGKDGAGKDGALPAMRTVELQLQARQLIIQPPRHAKAGEIRTPQQVWVVRAWEADPPAGETPIEWVLISTFPVEGAEGAAQLVRYYAFRWRIERLHYTIKSGCRAEELQHDDADTLQKALALYYVVAWRLLWLTYLARTEPEGPIEAVFTPVEVAVLRASSRKPLHTVQDAVRAIAGLAGWRGYRSAPDPGVKMLWLGLQRLDAMSWGWRLAQGQPPDPRQA